MTPKVIFNGIAREISVISGTLELNVQTDLYSYWKEWVKTNDNSKFLAAFRTTAGDSLGAGKIISPYFFIINNWVIRPADADHTLLIEGNLYADPVTNDIIVPSTGSYTVNAILQRAVDAITTTVSGSGGGLTTAQDYKLTSTYLATGITTASIDEVITSQSLADNKFGTVITSQSLADTKLNEILAQGTSSLTPDQADMLLRLYQVMGLDPTKPLVVTEHARTVSAEISQSFVVSGSKVTVTRTI